MKSMLLAFLLALPAFAVPAVDIGPIPQTFESHQLQDASRDIDANWVRMALIASESEESKAQAIFDKVGFAKSGCGSTDDCVQELASEIRKILGDGSYGKFQAFFQATCARQSEIVGARDRLKERLAAGLTEKETMNGRHVSKKEKMFSRHLDQIQKGTQLDRFGALSLVLLGRKIRDLNLPSKEMGVQRKKLLEEFRRQAAKGLKFEPAVNS